MSKHCNWNPEFGTGGVLECKCDKCGKTKKFKFTKHPDYRDAHNRLKKIGWLARKLGDTWYDFCSDECFDKFRQE